MNKAQLVGVVSESVGCTKKEAEKAITVFFDEALKALLAGETVKVSGFGVFTLKNRKERVGTSPNTGEKITIPAAKTIGFKPAKSLKATLK